MTVTTKDLGTFLDDLSVRRERLNELLAGGDPSQLNHELVALGEQLLIADEELRVQHEELDDVRLQLAERTFEREILFASAPTVVTDAHGAVVLANPAAISLADQPPTAPRRRRPIGSWFASDDRDRITELAEFGASTRGAAQRDGLRLRHRDGSTVVVDVSVSPVPGAIGRGRLRWELRGAAVHSPRPSLQLVGPPATVVDDLVADDLASFALELGELDDAAEVLTAVAATSVGLVPGADAAAITLLRKGAPELAAATSPGAAALQARDFETGFGPAFDVCEAGSGATVLSVDLAADPRWRSGARASLDAGLRTVVCVCIALPSLRRTAVLSCYGSRAGGLGDDAEHLAVLVAAHASVALTRAVNEANLRIAAESRQRVGEAVGILAEREGLTTAAAFQRLVTTSQRANRPLREIARALVESTEASSG